MSRPKFAQQNQYEQYLYFGDGYFDALFMPEVDQSDIFVGKMNNSTGTWTPEAIKQKLKDVADISFETPEKYSDKLLGFAVMGNAFTVDNFKQIYDDIKSLGEAQEDDLSVNRTGLMCYFHNVCGYDAHQYLRTLLHLRRSMLMLKRT